MDASKFLKNVLFSILKALISIFILLEELSSEWPLTLIALPTQLQCQK